MTKHTTPIYVRVSKDDSLENLLLAYKQACEDMGISTALLRIAEKKKDAETIDTLDSRLDLAMAHAARIRQIIMGAFG